MNLGTPFLQSQCQRKLRQVDYRGAQVVCRVHTSAQKDEATLLNSSNGVWQTLRLSGQPTCLVMDSCAVHETPSIKEALRRPDTKNPIYTKRLYGIVTSA